MGIKSLLRRMRRALWRNNRPVCDKGKGKVVGLAQSAEVHAKPPIGQARMELRSGPAGEGAIPSQPQPISRDDMQRSASNQDTSIFFSKLPLEIRRQIYGEVWRSYLGSPQGAGTKPDVRLHIYTDGAGRGFRHTQCRIHHGAPNQDDVQVIEPWPFNTTNKHTPPMWFWFAFITRLHWDKHWKCQHQIMKRWDPETGNAKPADPSPFLQLFLSCKKMYFESISYLFETIKPVFTSSEDAHRFFIHNPHPFLSSIRSLEFSFTNPNDHLFLAQVQRPAATLGDSKTETQPSSGSTQSISHASIPCRLEVFGPTLWADLVRGVEREVPDLRDFDVTIGGRLEHDEALKRFGGRDTQADEEGEIEQKEGMKPWTLPGRMSVFFKSDDQWYLQDGGRMVMQSA